MICRHDRTAEVCRAAVEEDGWQLENVPEEVKTPELCRKALETEAGFGNDRFRLVQHIPSPEVCMEVLKECSKVCPEELYGVAASIRPEVMNGEMADFLLPLDGVQKDKSVKFDKETGKFSFSDIRQERKRGLKM